ncbi:MAG TPA: carboxypeptidase-like regulatory domain-containing protein, partial [Pyrinomonadaceae bacterium]
MKQVILFLTVLLAAQIAYAQNTFKAIIKNEETKEAVAGAKVSVKDTEISATTDANGRAELTNVPEGEQIIEIFSAGYETKELKIA